MRSTVDLKHDLAKLECANCTAAWAKRLPAVYNDNLAIANQNLLAFTIRERRSQ